MRALVVGGTGPTGPHVVEGLVARGYEVTVFHRGTHEAAGLPPVEHIHGDPHFRATIDAALQGRTFDVVIAMYGRLRHLAGAVAGRCERLVAVGGVAAYRGAMDPAAAHPYGMQLLSPEDGPTVDPQARETPEQAAVALIRRTEQHILQLHDEGAFAATLMRYPSIYGPRQVFPAEWSVIRRILDRRPFIVLPDGGLAIYSRSGARNAAHAVLLAAGAGAPAGTVYNVADDTLLSLRQWVELIAELMETSIDVASLPAAIATPAVPIARVPAHVVVDASRIRRELGYADIVPLREGMRETIDWYLQHPVRPEDYPAFTDRFDYEAEDRLVDAYRGALAGLGHLAGEPPAFVHPYAHPDTAALSRDQRSR